MSYQVGSQELMGLYGTHLDFDYKDKMILDIGADVGSTAEFFLFRGARFVWCVEGVPELAAQCQENINRHFPKKAETIVEFISTPWAMERLISFWGASGPHQTDLIKIDIEGWENTLLHVSDRIIAEQKEFIIDFHSKLLGVMIGEKLVKNGFTLLKDTCGDVIHAVKKAP